SLSLRITKRAKVSASAEPDLQRRLRSTSALVEESIDVIHAADITSSGKKPAEFTSAFVVDGEPAVVSLQYPGHLCREKYVTRCSFRLVISSNLLRFCCQQVSTRCSAR